MSITARKSFKRQHAIFPEGKSMTQQHQRDECNINLIVPKANKAGFLQHANRAQGAYEDLSNALDYKSSLDLCIAAQDSFNELPAVIRKEFQNDPGVLLEFMQNPDNLDRAIELGLAEKPPVEVEEVIPDALGKNAVKPPDPEPETGPAQ